MISLFFIVSRGKQLLRIDVEEGKNLPSSILFTARAVYDHKMQAWSKFDTDSLGFADTPDMLKAEVDHTFFHILGLCWHITSDSRFTKTFRANCSHYCTINCNLHLVERAAWVVINYLKHGCFNGRWVDSNERIDDTDPAYNFFPL